jgi:hypothetical protein
MSLRAFTATKILFTALIGLSCLACSAREPLALDSSARIAARASTPLPPDYKTVNYKTGARPRALASDPYRAQSMH